MDTNAAGSSFQKIASIPKLEKECHADYERFAINRQCTTALFFTQSESDPSNVTIKLLSLKKGGNFLQEHDSGIEKDQSEMPVTFIRFLDPNRIIEFNLNTKTGVIYAIQNRAFVYPREISVPYQWNSLDILKIEMTLGQGVFLFYRSDRGVKSLELCQLREEQGKPAFVPFKTMAINHEETVFDIKIKQINNYGNFLSSIKYADRLEIVNHFYVKGKIREKRFFIKVSKDIYDIIFVQGYFFIFFKDGSVSHINHAFFFNFPLKG